MENRFGVKGTLCDGIFFTEASVHGAVIVEHLRIEISRQNANLTEVKQKLAKQVCDLGATALINFRYGQKKHSWWELVFSFKWDTESWYGEGDAVKL